MSNFKEKWRFGTWKELESDPGMSFNRVNDRYADYKTLISRMYPRLDMEFAELVTAVMESLDPTPDMPPEERYRRNLERKIGRAHV